MGATRFLRKILAPTLPSAILHRERLFQMLERALISVDGEDMPVPHHLILLCAPAGYGKTTLLADSIKRLSQVCCWYFLDPSDTDRVIFLEVLITSIRRHFPSFGRRLDTLLAEVVEQDDTARYQRLLDALIDALEADIPERCILALCNYHEVSNSQAINEVVNQLLQRLPPQWTLVVESRAMPDLELAPLIVRRKMFAIGSNGLRFTTQDLLDLAQVQNIDAFSEEEAEQLTTAFDGWIAGILLGSRLGQTQFDYFAHASNGESPIAYANRQHLFAFLVKEVFRDDQKIYHFLKDTSLLERLDPAFCNALLEISDAGTRLEYARRRGLFVMSIDKSGETTYVCHSILRELFREELRSHDNKRYCTLQRRIAVLLHQAHENEAALTHALEAQDHNLVATIVLETVPSLLHQGQNEIVRRWLDHLPMHICRTHPRLLFLHINTYLRLGDFANARALLEDAGALCETSLSAHDNIEHTLVRAELSISRGKLLASQGEHQLAQKHFLQALELLPVDERALRTRAHQQLGVSILLGGEPLRGAIAQFQQALQLCHASTDEILAGELHHQLAIAYGWAGNFAVAEHHRRRVIAIQERLDQPRRVINNLTSMGLLKLYQGFVEEAEALFDKVLKMAREVPPLPSTEAYALLALGELELNRERFVQALMCLEEALILAHQLEDRYLLNCTLSMLVLVYLRMDDIDTARCLLDQIVLRANETRSYEGFLYTLIKGTLLLAQCRHDEAHAAFEQAVSLTREAGIQRLLLQGLMRQAVCRLEQGQRMQAANLLRQVATINKKGDHDYTRRIELQSYPALEALMQEVVEQGEDFATVQPQEIPDVTVAPPEYPDIKVVSAAQLSIYALGEPTVLIDHVPVTRWRMARAMELYFFLLESNQPLRKDQIITTLWQESEDIERINQTFRSTVYYLRRVIGDACLVQRSGLYRLDLGAVYSQFWYDVAAFEEQQLIARAALEEEEDQSAAQAFRKMVDLYRGDYVQSFYSDWCIWKRDELRKAFMEAHRQLALIAWRREEWDESLQHWQHLLTLDPCLETAHYGMMRCYLRQGKRDLALRQYQRCSQELREQLKAKPGPKLQKLYQRLANPQT